MIIKKFIPKYVSPKIDFHLAENQKLLLVPLGDIHFGAEGFPLAHFKDTIQWLLDRGAVFLGMGEPFDFTSYSQRQQIAPLRDSTKKEIDKFIQSQVEELSEILLPTKNKWIGMLEGDHYWTFTDACTSDQKLCEILNCDFLGTMGFITISMGVKGHPEANTKVIAHHGVGTARTTGGHFNRVEDLTKFFEADIFLMGHSHAKQASPTDRQCITPDGVHYHKTQIIARTGAWLRQYLSQEPLAIDKPAIFSRGTYAEIRAYMPAAMGCLAIGVGYEKINNSSFYRPALHVST